ncbi:transporter substrate-binding domain-containing protein [Aquamicrobium segne]|uniref:Transporter substrate-binding domain-containing protein n=1 Tax=Aquamicrobium segne TaxID=469547 RepID=A0ABW0GTK3_9HYPH
MSFRIAVASIFLLAGLLPLPGKSADAQALDIPLLWDLQERPTRPDLSALTRLRFLTATDFPPFNFLDDQGRLSGFHIDLARAICDGLALADKCQIQALPWDELQDALEKGEGEAIIAGLAVTAQTRTAYAFSRPYLQFPARFVMRKSQLLTEPLDTKLQDKPVGVITGTAHERMLRDYFNKLRIVSVADEAELYAQLKSGKIEAAFADGMRLSFWLADTESEQCCAFAGGPYIAPEYLGTGMAIATRIEDASLAAAFDHALQDISAKNVFSELYLRYFPIGFY